MAATYSNRIANTEMEASSEALEFWQRCEESKWNGSCVLWSDRGYIRMPADQVPAASVTIWSDAPKARAG